MVETASRNLKSETCGPLESLSPPPHCFGAQLASVQYESENLEATWSCGVDRYYEKVDCSNEGFHHTNGYTISIDDVKNYFDSVQNSVRDWFNN